MKLDKEYMNGRAVRAALKGSAESNISFFVAIYVTNVNNADRHGETTQAQKTPTIAYGGGKIRKYVYPLA